MIRIIVKAGTTFNGTKHFVPTRYEVSEEWARQMIAQGVAELDEAGNHLSDPNSFKGPKG